MPGMPLRLAVALVLLSQQSIGVAVLTAVEHFLKTRSVVTAQIRGRVFDEFGASIPDASVAFEPLDQLSGLTAFGAVADSRGRFDFIGVRPGTYRVTGKALGFETTVIIQEVMAGVDTEVTIVVRRRPARITRPASEFEARRPDTRRARNRNATR